MWGFQLSNYLSSIFRNSPVDYLGLFNSNEFDPFKSIERNKAYFTALNCDKSHWIALFGKDNFVFCLDPLGKDIGVYSAELSQALQELYGAENIIHLPFRIQPLNTHTCGYFICYWAFLLVREQDFPAFYHPFSAKHLRSNNQLIVHWFSEHFHGTPNLQGI